MTDIKRPSHQPVLLEPAISGLITNKKGIYIDGTYGRGGHSREILNTLSPQASLWVFDQDNAAIEEAKRLQQHDSRVQIFHDNFRHIKQQVEWHGITGKIDGLLLDIGVSSPQLDEPTRGFSFQHNGPLDMRMNNQQGITALEWLQQTNSTQIRRAFREFADVKEAGKWARLIKEKLSIGEIKETMDLANLIWQYTPKKVKAKMSSHPATQIFQAIRIAVNDEIGALKEVLQGVHKVLGVGGRLVVISFHSVEHRLLRHFARGNEADLPKHFPQVRRCDWEIIRLLDFPTEREVEQNIRARSARLSILQKVEKH